MCGFGIRRIVKNRAHYTEPNGMETKRNETISNQIFGYWHKLERNWGGPDSRRLYDFTYDDTKFGE